MQAVGLNQLTQCSFAPCYSHAYYEAGVDVLTISQFVSLKLVVAFENQMV